MKTEFNTPCNDLDPRSGLYPRSRPSPEVTVRVLPRKYNQYKNETERLKINHGPFSLQGGLRAAGWQRGVRGHWRVQLWYRRLQPGRALFQHSGECGDVDECSSDIDDCSPDELCFNTVGSWSCCLPGYQLGDDGQTCTDIDECQSGPDSVCPQGQTCFNTPGSKVCCEDGLWPNCTDTSRSKEGVLDE